MRSFTPPRLGGASEPDSGWGLRRAVRLTFPAPAAVGHDAAHTARLGTYLTDLLRPYELEIGPGALERGGQSYGEMAEALIASIVSAGEEIDLLVLAYAIPDFAPGRATATYLSHVCPGGPMAFAISDQGTAAAFTGLRLIREYARETPLRRALLLVVEQAALPYDAGVPVTVPDGNTGVALLFGDPVDAAVPSERTLRLGSVTVQAGCSDSALVDSVDSLLVGPTGSTSVVGGGLADALMAAERPLDGDRVRLASRGRPYTGVWWELAGLFAEAGPQPERVLLADYEPGSRSYCVAEFAVAPMDVDDSLLISALIDGSLA